MILNQMNVLAAATVTVPVCLSVCLSICRLRALSVNPCQVFGEAFETVEVHQPLNQQPLSKGAASAVRRLDQVAHRVASHRHVLNEPQDCRRQQADRAH